MSLGTPQFLLFFAVFATVYYLLPHKLRCGWLLLGNIAFYAFGAPGYLPLLAVTVLGSYFAARGIERRDGAARKTLTSLSVVVLVAVLCLFKYLARPLGTLLASVPLFAPLIVGNAAGAFSLIMPLGISFYSFSVIGYLLDVSNGKVRAERNVIVYSLFVTFFPTLLSGPINRAGELLPQFYEEHRWDYRRTVEGLQRFLLGAFKKVVLADGLSLVVNGVWSNLQEYYGLTLLVVMLLYTIQLYCDFAGYSDMAVGAARILGFTVRENFSAPFMATNMSGMWLRWHMSLTTWFNDYIFLPLVWSRWANKLFFGKKWEEHKPHFALNTVVIFLMSGAWHGNTVTYVIWGLLNGLLRLGEEMLHKIKPLKRRTKQHPIKLWSKRAVVFLLFSFTLVFFRAPSLAAAWGFLSRMVLLLPTPLVEITGKLLFLVTDGLADSGTYYLLLFGGLAIGFAVLVWSDLQLHRGMAQKHKNPHNTLALLQKPAVRMGAYWILGILTMLFYFISFTKLNGGVSFIYAGF